MRKYPSLPGFSGDVSLGVSGGQYRGAGLPVGGAVLVARFALPIGGGFGIISRCGASCKCCSADGNNHCCVVCDRCSPSLALGGELA
jgi:hypothetical protein